MRPLSVVSAVVPIALLAGIIGLGDARGRPATAGPVVVKMNDALRFLPKRVTIRVGRRVVWRNAGRIAHTVTTVRAKASNKADARVPLGVKAWDSGFIGAGERYSRTFKVPGVYRYFCIPHEGARMVGTLVVTR